MAVKEIEKILHAVPDFLRMSHEQIWVNYDKEPDVLYINFKKPSYSDDSKLIDDDIIIRYEKNKIIGVTVLNASKRSKNQKTKL